MAATLDGRVESDAVFEAKFMLPWQQVDGIRLSKLDLLIIQIDGLHIGNDLVLVAALGIDGNGDKHPLGLVEGATENTLWSRR